ncbi:MAG: iron-sulfur cluster assembly scaffold protein [Planctomycetaceae bacterium]|jgi:NifU-like protein|nr:iron-sulfur cluster assembly scaffold protein [Planctomycetaceae bacterium]
MPWEYSDKTKELFSAAVQGEKGTHLGEIPNPDGKGEHGSIACGDALSFTFRVERNSDPFKDVIVEARYLTFGCTSAIASSEALCRIIESKRFTPVEALKITNKDIVDFVGGLPEQKIHCSVMGAEALQAAVFDWAKKRGVDLNAIGIDTHQKEQQDESRIVCNCFVLSESYIRRKIKELNLRTISEITGSIKAGGACTLCQNKQGGLQDILDEIWGNENRVRAAGNNSLRILSDNLPEQNSAKKLSEQTTQPTSSSGGGNSTFKFFKQIEKVIDEKIRPVLMQDGGDLELIDIKDKTVYVGLQGACSACAGAGQTIKFLVEDLLKENIDVEIRVIQV